MQLVTPAGLEPTGHRSRVICSTHSVVPAGVDSKETIKSIVGVLNIEDLVAKFAKFGTLERFGEEISQHFIGRAVLNRDLISGDMIRDPKIPNINVSHAFTAGRPAVLL